MVSSPVGRIIPGGRIVKYFIIESKRRDRARDVSRREAEITLGEITRLQTHTRHAWGSPWFALVCFGFVTVLAAIALLALGSAGLVATWALGGAGALVLIRRYYRRRGRRVGITGRGRLAWHSSLGAFGLCFLAAAVGGQANHREGGVVASIVVVLASYLVLGSWQRRADPPVAIAVAAMPALVLAALSAAPWVVELTFGAALIAAGAILRVKTVPA